MNTKVLAGTAYLVILSIPLSAGCQSLERTSHDIVLNGFSDRNYVGLNRGMGASVCISGRISIDTAGVYFALRPIRDGDIIDIGFSRIISGLSDEQVRRNNMVSGGRYRVCGTLRDATPFRQCDYDHCKWYRLENAELL
jgi:hypothetical protein